jgi:anaerobic selenocysteine-containing dehydrogenase
VEGQGAGPPGREDVWEEFKRRGVYKFEFDKPLVAFREQIEKGKPFETPSGKIEIFSTTLARSPTGRRRSTAIRSRHPEVDRALRVAQPPEGQESSPST